ncbi:TetR/AcrR family transcriptional regulator [Marinobacter sp.]|uniref:TetR/AcrR family transcriptional regulator n=1 Tax=Marinobacter sp. TaxID=50741 RepID=UPI003565FB8B
MTKRGRPKRTEGQVEDTRNCVLHATRRVFGLYGAQGTTVGKIIHEANISRPTFYRYFDNAGAALSLVVEAANLKLVQAVVENVEGLDGLLPLFQAITDTYLDWGREEIDIIHSIHQDLLTPGSVVAVHRAKTIDRLYQLVESKAGKHSKTLPDKVVLETIMMAGENLGYHALLHPDEANIESYRSGIVKLAIALMGDQNDWVLAARNHMLFK